MTKRNSKGRSSAGSYLARTRRSGQEKRLAITHYVRKDVQLSTAVADAAHASLITLTVFINTLLHDFRFSYGLLLLLHPTS
jgi:hypothetical protein